MSSTEVTVDTREFEFVLNEWLHVGTLSELDMYKDFDADTLDLMVKEGHKFCIEVISPTRAETDREGCKLVAGHVKVPACMKAPYKKAYELGWAVVSASPKHGGQGAPQLIGMAHNEASIAANMPLTMFFALTQGASHLIEVYGSEALQKKYVPKMLDGSFVGTMCLSEPNAGSDVGANATTAEPVGGGRYKIKGTKSWISGGDSDLGINTVHAVLARVKGAPPGTKGLSLFVVPKYTVNDDGSVGGSNDVVVGSLEHKMGINGSPTCVINFGENDQCYGELIGEEGKGMAAMFQLMNEARLGTGGLGLAMAAAAYQNALSYAKERIQGAHINNMREANPPKVAIIEHPDVRLNLLNMKARVEATRALLYGTLNHLDRSLAEATAEKRQEHDDLVQVLTPMCKGFATEVGVDVIGTGIQVLGGVGYTKDFPMEQLYRDLRVTTVYEGTTGIQALDLVGRKLTMRNGELFMKLLGRFGKMVEDHSGHPVIGPTVQAWAQYCETLSDVAMAVPQVLQSRGMAGVALAATPFLMFCASVSAGYFFLEQALVAAESLEKLKKNNGVDDRGYSQFLDNNSDARFYDAKLKTVRFYVETVIPCFEGMIAIAKKRNYDPLDIRL